MKRNKITGRNVLKFQNCQQLLDVISGRQSNSVVADSLCGKWPRVLIEEIAFRLVKYAEILNKATTTKNHTKNRKERDREKRRCTQSTTCVVIVKPKI